MATGWGVEKNGDDGFGTNDARLISAAQYTVGVLQGCQVVTSSTGLTYSVTRGTSPSSVAVGSASAADGNVLFPVDEGTKTGPVAAGDSTNPRVDSVYAVQHDPSAGDTDNHVVVVAVSGTPAAAPVEPAAPAGIVVKLGSFLVPASAATTSEATPYGDITYSIPYGASLPNPLHSWTDQFNGVADQGNRNLGAGSFFLPTDRAVVFEIMPTISTEAVGKTGSCIYHFVLDGEIVQSYEISYDGYWQTKYQPYFTTLSAGRHDVSFGRYKRAGDDFYQHYGAINGEIYAGTIFQVRDLGVTS